MLVIGVAIAGVGRSADSGGAMSAGTAISLISLAATVYFGVQAHEDSPHPNPGSPSATPTGLATSNTPAGRKAYITRVSSLCRSANTEVDKAGMPADNIKSSIAWMNTTNPVFADLYTEWANISAPAEDATKIRAILGPLDKLNSHLRGALLQLNNESRAATQAQYDEFRRQENVEWSSIREASSDMGIAIDDYDARGLAGCKTLIQF
jgi:hypothetical protein